jgi:hypothetical protein
MGPISCVGRYDVEMPVQEHRRGRGIFAVDSGKDAGTAWSTLDKLWLESNIVQQSGNVLSSIALLRARIIPVVAGVELDQPAADLDNLTSRIAER